MTKIQSYYNLLVKWVTIYQSNRSVADFFVRNGYKKVAIYGLKELGVLLYDELDHAGIDIPFVIDQRADYINTDIEVELYMPEDDLPDADVVVVTACFYFDEIVESLKDKVKCPIISLEEAIRCS